MERTIQIDCVLEFTVECSGLTQTEVIDKVRKILNDTSYKEIGEKLQIDSVLRDWHVLDEEGEEEHNHYGCEEPDYEPYQ